MGDIYSFSVCFYNFLPYICTVIITNNLIIKTTKQWTHRNTTKVES